MVGRERRQRTLDEREERQATLQEAVFNAKAQEVQREAEQRRAGQQAIQQEAARLEGAGDTAGARRLILLGQVAPDKIPDAIIPKQPDPISPYQQAQLDFERQRIDLERQRVARSDAPTPLQLAQLKLAQEDNALARKRFELESRGGGGAFGGNGLETSLLNTVFDLDRKAAKLGGFDKLPEDDQVKYRFASSRLDEIVRINDPVAGTSTEIRKGLDGVLRPPPLGQPGPAATMAQAPGTVPNPFAEPPPVASAAGPGGTTVTTTRVGEPRPEKIQGELRGRAGLQPGTFEDLKLVRDKLLPDGPEGEVDRTTLLTMSPPGGDIPLLGRVVPSETGVPFTSGREARSAYERAADALLRIKTGAGQSEAEARRTIAQYQPLAGDNAETVKSKLAALERDLRNTAESIQTGLAPGGAQGRNPFKEDADATAAELKVPLDTILSRYAEEQGISLEAARAKYEGR